ncbi:hypothetical protein EPUL_000745 [Erysiphe pulchra]|uniref:Uncharacterized protein n=1 Tax=Erysiphe pulchra TaxID=225359 RepID=A0A2S4Q0N5_9PEZI|nr:hypothetical protein EPUL_000745 [Erysiphe pulchra]
MLLFSTIRCFISISSSYLAINREINNSVSDRLEPLFATNQLASKRRYDFTKEECLEIKTALNLGLFVSPRNEAYQISNYLPKELREIIQKRQDQERAWHVRLSTCASVVCKVENTLQMYKGDIEKQESEFIQDYLQKAITRLVASQNS